jgi:hypothetical protein
MRFPQAMTFLGACALAVGAGAGTATAQTPEGPTDVCALLTVDEVAKTIGQPVGEGTPSTRELSGSQGTRDSCTWETQQADTGILGGTRLQLVASLQSNCANPDPKACFKADKQVARGKHEEKDLKKISGHEAFYEYTGEVEVLVGSRILNVHFNNFNTNMFSRKSFERRTVDAAKQAEKRL